MNQNYVIRYKLANGDFRVYDNNTGEITTRKKIDDKHIFFMQKSYETSDTGLLKYSEDFKKCAKELYKNDIYNIHYTNFHSDYGAVYLTFKNLSNKRLSNHPVIDLTEYKWIEACPNGSLQYCEPQTCKSYASDFTSAYPGVLTTPEFMIPTKGGEEKIIRKLKTNLKLGYYRVKITCDNKDFLKLFVFSKDHVYTSHCIDHARKHQKEFKVKIELIQDDGPNAYIYNDDDLIKSSSIFSRWFYKMKALKKAFPKNMLVKHLFSSLWGSLISFNKINLTWDRIEKEGLKVGMTLNADYIIRDHKIYDNQEYYEVIDVKQPYRYNIRIKAFLTSCVRNLTAFAAYEHLDNVIRIHTDCIVFNKKVKLYIPYLVPEEKTSGMIKWNNVNSYHKKCCCGVWYHNTQRSQHKECS